MIQSLELSAVFVIYVALTFGPILPEQQELEKAYGPRSIAYQRKTKMLVPAIYRQHWA